MSGRRSPAPSPAGAHFLRDRTLITRLVRASGAGDGQLALDLGAGYGSITAALAAAGPRVIAVERDPQLAGRLQRRFGGHPRVTVVTADVREVPLPRRDFLVVASIPFAVTTGLLRRLLGDPAVPLAGAELIVGWGAGCWLARPTPRDEETAWWAARYQIRLAGRIPAASFAPPPRGDAARLSVRPRPLARSPGGQRILRQLLREAFRGGRPPVGVRRRVLLQAGIAPGTPGVELTADEWSRLATALAGPAPEARLAGPAPEARNARLWEEGEAGPAGGWPWRSPVCHHKPVTDVNSPGAVFRAARDLLLRLRDDYDAALREFGWPRVERFNWALDWFDVIAAEHPDRDALRIVADGGSDVRLTYAELSARSSQVANWLRDLGVRRGDRVLLMLGNIAPLWEVILAAIKLGAVVIPATTLLGPDDVADRIARGDVRHVITESAQTPKFGAVPEPGQRGRWTPIAVGEPAEGWLDYSDAFAAEPWYTPDGMTLASDPLLLYFTSGTTAQPKLVEHTHVSYPVGHLSTMYWLGLQPGDVHLNVSSPGWAKHAWSNVFAPWNAGATVMVLGHERFSVDALLAAIPGCGVSTLCAPPTVWRMLIQSDLGGYDTSSLRECVSAGEPLNPEVIEQVRRAWGITVRDGYGQTETTAQIGNPPGQEVRLGSMGRALPGYTVMLVDPLIGVPGKEGEICLPAEPPAARPAGLMTGYRGDPQRAAESMRDGYYHTGDVATIDADGYITYVGRTDDVFKASDYRISPFELESVLIEHEAVAEAAVVPSPDPMRLAVPKAYVTLAPGTEPSAPVALSILAFARQRLAPYKRVRRLEFGELPKTISGKIRRVQLREQEHQRHSEGGEPGAGGDSQAGPGTRGVTEFWEEDFPDLKQ